MLRLKNKYHVLKKEYRSKARKNLELRKENLELMKENEFVKQLKNSMAPKAPSLRNISNKELQSFIIEVINQVKCSPKLEVSQANQSYFLSQSEDSRDDKKQYENINKIGIEKQRQLDMNSPQNSNFRTPSTQRNQLNNNANMIPQTPPTQKKPNKNEINTFEDRKGEFNYYNQSLQEIMGSKSSSRLVDSNRIMTSPSQSQNGSNNKQLKSSQQKLKTKNK